MQIEFKKAEIFDDETLAGLIIESFPEEMRSDEMFRSLSKAELLDSYKKSFEEIWECLHFWLIKNAGEAIGYLFVTSRNTPHGNCGGNAAVFEIYLPPTFRNHGIESQALNIAEDFCDEKSLHLSFNAKPEWRVFEENL